MRLKCVENAVCSLCVVLFVYVVYGIIMHRCLVLCCVRQYQEHHVLLVYVSRGTL